MTRHVSDPIRAAQLGGEKISALPLGQEYFTNVIQSLCKKRGQKLDGVWQVIGQSCTGAAEMAAMARLAGDCH